MKKMRKRRRERTWKGMKWRIRKKKGLIMGKRKIEKIV